MKNTENGQQRNELIRVIKLDLNYELLRWPFMVLFFGHSASCLSHQFKTHKLPFAQTIKNNKKKKVANDKFSTAKFFRRQIQSHKYFANRRFFVFFFIFAAERRACIFVCWWKTSWLKLINNIDCKRPFIW